MSGCNRDLTSVVHERTVNRYNHVRIFVIHVIPTLIGEGIPLVAPTPSRLDFETIDDQKVLGWSRQTALCRPKAMIRFP